MPPQQQDGEVLQTYGHPKIAFFHLFWKVCLAFGEQLSFWLAAKSRHCDDTG